MTVKQMEKSIAEIWELFRETDRRMKETDRKIAEAVKAIADLGGKWGRFVEGLVVPAVENLFKEWGIELEKVSPRVKARRNGDQMEIDVLALNREYAMLIEVKSTLGVEDVKEHLERLASFKAFFPEYQDRKVLGAVAGIVIEAGADRFAYQNGLFVIGQTGETVKVLNDRKFKPREW